MCDMVAANENHVPPAFLFPCSTFERFGFCKLVNKNLNHCVNQVALQPLAVGCVSYISGDRAPYDPEKIDLH